jgi:hypothetical protein
MTKYCKKLKDFPYSRYQRFWHHGRSYRTWLILLDGTGIGYDWHKISKNISIGYVYVSDNKKGSGKREAEKKYKRSV